MAQLISKSKIHSFFFTSVGLVYIGSLGVLQCASNRFLIPFVTIWPYSGSLTQSTSLLCINGKAGHAADTEEKTEDQIKSAHTLNWLHLRSSVWKLHSGVNMMLPETVAKR